MKLHISDRLPPLKPSSLPAPGRRAAERPETGARGEAIAVAHLVAAGYRVVARNWTVRDGEIDVIARAPEGDRLVFVEVRTRWRGAPVAPETTVTRPKQRRVERLARIFLARNAQRYAGMMATFDVIGVWLPDEEVTHVPCAFEGDVGLR